MSVREFGPRLSGQRPVRISDPFVVNRSRPAAPASSPSEPPSAFRGGSAVRGAPGASSLR